MSKDPNLNWLDKNFEKYEGEWVALSEGELLAFSKTLKGLMKEIIGLQHRHPLIHKMERTEKMTEKVCGFENINTFNVVAYMENHSEASFRLFCQMADCVKDSLILTREEQINVLAEHYMEFFLQMPPALFDEGISRVGTWRHKMQYLAKVNWVEVAEHFYDW